jgi:hypothetical protein
VRAVDLPALDEEFVYACSPDAEPRPVQLHFDAASAAASPAADDIHEE